MISIQHLDKYFGKKDLFVDCELFIGPSDRVGLVGENGTGKTTLLRILLGLEAPNSGKIVKPKGLRIGHLPQEVIELSGTSVLDHVTDVAQELKRIENEINRISGELGEAEGRDTLLGLAKRQGYLLERFNTLGGYQLESQAKKILSGLGFREEEFNLPIESLSGGWIMRASLARILLSAPDLILLDEPTNHLDLESLLWLEDYLKGITSALLIITHDRAFLNRVVERIIEIDACKFISYAGNYDFYRAERAKREEIRWAAYRKQQEGIAQIQRFIEKNRVRKDRAKQVQSRIKLLERMDRIDAPRRSKSINFQFSPPPRATKSLIELRGVSKSYDSHVVYRDINLSILRGDRIALLGPNGVGKTTLMRILSGDLDFEEGERLVNPSVHIASFSQRQMEHLSPQNTVLDELRSVAGDQSLGKLRAVLGAFLFQDEDTTKRVSLLSGGEKSRLLLCKILMARGNLLLLDEPTNHLDIPSSEALEEALRQYGGTLCLITHDRRLINAIANKVLVVRDKALDLYPGNFDDYQRIWVHDQESSSPREGPKEAVHDPRTIRRKTQEQKRAEAEWRNRFHRESSPLRKRLGRLEEEIHKSAALLDQLDHELLQPETYRDSTRLGGIRKSRHELKEKIDGLTREWESVAEQLDDLERQFEASKPDLREK
ncbi:MAG: ABC-F family ATP-binding cassette domain-containing protein [Thermodesulfobacteriota bacterium]